MRVISRKKERIINSLIEEEIDILRKFEKTKDKSLLIRLTKVRKEQIKILES